MGSAGFFVGLFGTACHVRLRKHPYLGHGHGSIAVSETEPNCSHYYYIFFWYECRSWCSSFTIFRKDGQACQWVYPGVCSGGRICRRPANAHSATFKRRRRQQQRQWCWFQCGCWQRHQWPDEEEQRQRYKCPERNGAGEAPGYVAVLCATTVDCAPTATLLCACTKRIAAASEGPQESSQSPTFNCSLSMFIFILGPLYLHANVAMVLWWHVDIYGSRL